MTTNIRTRRKPRKTPVRRVLEKHVLASIKFWLEANGCLVWRRNVGALKAGTRYTRFAEKGQADLYGILPNGLHFELEVKRPKARPRPEQLAFLNQVNNHGSKRAVGFWADDVEIVKRVLRGVLRGARVEIINDRGDYDLVY
jgi:hypothetical protein